jgi:ribosome-associated protein
LKAPTLHELARQALENIKGQDIVLMDISKMSSIADYMLVVTATSNRHARSLSDEVVKRCKEAGFAVRSMEGEVPAEWILIDLGDVIVHVMQASARKLYDLESLWKLAPSQ